MEVSAAMAGEVVRLLEADVESDDLLAGRIDVFQRARRPDPLENATSLLLQRQTLRVDAALYATPTELVESETRHFDHVALMGNAIVQDACVRTLVTETLADLAPPIGGLIFATHWRDRPLRATAVGFTRAISANEVIAIHDPGRGRYWIDCCQVVVVGDRLEMVVAGTVRRLGAKRPQVTLVRVSDLRSFAGS
jgi:hypothetical protein